MFRPIPGPFFGELNAITIHGKGGFNSAHIRPSGVGSCVRAQVLSVLSGLYPADPAYTPTDPAGKSGLANVAAIGNAYEAMRFAAWEKLVPPGFILYGGANQYDLKHTRLKNPDGSPITAHPDIVLAGADGTVYLDEEVKTATNANTALPRSGHIKQRLLRQHIWRLNGHNPYGRIHYAFRDSAHPPMDYGLVPTEEGMVGFWENDPDDQTLYTWESINSLNDRLTMIAAYITGRVIPEREAPDHNYYECDFPKLDSRCLWRSSCWAEELAYEARPAAAAPGQMNAVLDRYAELSLRRTEIDRESREISAELKKTQKGIDFLFDNFGDKIATPRHEIERSLVTVPERVTAGYTFKKYAVKAVAAASCK